MACFALAARFRSLPWQQVLAVAAAVIFLLSLAGSILQTPVDGRNSGFYLPHWRAWEFVIGGLVGFAVARPASTFRPVIGEASGVAGLLLIAFSILQYRADWVYPGYLALLPATGAAIVIAAGLLNPHARSMRLLSLPILTGIGLVSYGWYLWHWPLISFARIAQFGDASLVRDLAMAAMSLGLAVVTYRYVEQPALAWRQRRSLQLNGPGIVLSGIAASLASACVAGAVGGLAYWSTMQDPALTDKSAELAAAGMPGSHMRACSQPAWKPDRRTLTQTGSAVPSFAKRNGWGLRSTGMPCRPTAILPSSYVAGDCFSRKPVRKWTGSRRVAAGK